MQVSTAEKVFLWVVLLECLLVELVAGVVVAVSPSIVTNEKMSVEFHWNGTNPPDSFEVTMKGSGGDNTEYIAMGLSKDDKMGDDLVIACIPKNNKDNKEIAFFYTTGGTNNHKAFPVDITKGKPSAIENVLTEKKISCKITLPSIIETSKGSFNLMALKGGLQNVLVAEGAIVRENDANNKTLIVQHLSRFAGMANLPKGSGNKIMFESKYLALFIILGYFSGFGTQY